MNGAPCPTAAADESCRSTLVAARNTVTEADTTACTLVPAVVGSAAVTAADGSCTEVDTDVNTCQYRDAVAVCTDPTTSPEDGEYKTTPSHNLLSRGVSERWLRVAGVNILGLVSDTGDAVDASDDGAWNDADPSEARAYVCFCPALAAATTAAPAPTVSAAVRGTCSIAVAMLVAAAGCAF